MLFGEALGVRGRMRMARACSELWAVDAAFEDVTRPRKKDDRPASVSDVLLVQEVDGLYTCREFGRNAILDELICQEYRGQPALTVARLADICFGPIPMMQPTVALRETVRHVQAFIGAGLVTRQGREMDASVTLTGAGRVAAEAVRVTAIEGYPEPPGLVEAEHFAKAAGVA